MAPQGKSSPSRLGPPPQLSRHVPVVQQEHHKKFQHKLNEFFLKTYERTWNWIKSRFGFYEFCECYIFLYMILKIIYITLSYQSTNLLHIFIILEVVMGMWVFVFLEYLLHSNHPLLLIMSLMLFIASSVINYLTPRLFLVISDVGCLQLYFFVICGRVGADIQNLRKKKVNLEDNTSMTSSTELQPKSKEERIDIGNAVFSMDSMALSSMGGNRTSYNDTAIDLEPIDFEHFVEEPEGSENIFHVAFGDTPPVNSRGR